jgi:hypothetical protein
MNNWLLHILQESIKVSLIAVSVEQLIYLFLTRCCLFSKRCLMVEQTDTGWLRFVLRLRWWRTKSWSTRLLLTTSSHSSKGRIGRGRTHSTCLIGGSQTVQRWQDSRTCCVQFWQTLPIRVRLRVSLASSMRLTMTIRRSLTLTTLSYRYSRSLTNETCSSRVSSLR